MTIKPMPAAKVQAFLIVAVTLTASAAATISHSTPKTSLRRRHPAHKFNKREPRFVPTFDDEQKDYLNAHNDARKSMGMPPLRWNATLTAAARWWAEQRRRDCNVRRHSKQPYGENIFVMDYREFTPRDVVQNWFDERKLYDTKRLWCRCQPERPGCECGHFLNVVWRTTARLGCSGAVYCDDQKGNYIVCEYDPPAVASYNPFTGLPH